MHGIRFNIYQFQADNGYIFINGNIKEKAIKEEDTFIDSYKLASLTITDKNDNILFKQKKINIKLENKVAEKLLFSLITDKYSFYTLIKIANKIKKDLK